MGFLSNKGVRTGLFFGATSGVITTLGLMIGLNAGTHSLAAVLGGILVIAVLSYFIARVQEASPIAIIVEHLAIALLVVVLSHFIGVWVGKAFG